MPRTPELYFAFLGIQNCAIVGPLFEALWAVTDRLENSEAKVIVTTNSLLGRIPKDKLPHLETIVVVDDEVDEQYVDFNKELNQASEEFDIEWLKEDDGLIYITHQVLLVNLKGITRSKSNVTSLYFR